MSARRLVVQLIEERPTGEVWPICSVRFEEGVPEAINGGAVGAAQAIGPFLQAAKEAAKHASYHALEGELRRIEEERRPVVGVADGTPGTASVLERRVEG